MHASISGLLVRLLRERQGYSREHVARLAGLCRSTIGDIGRGTQQLDTFELGALSRALHIKEEAFAATVKDAKLRAKLAVLSSINRNKDPSEDGDPWWDLVLRATGSPGLRGLLAYATAAALQPWPESP